MCGVVRVLDVSDGGWTASMELDRKIVEVKDGRDG